MPTYEYRCEKCGFEFEREQRITEEPIRTCPKCNADKAKRLISATSFVLKGGGWYSDLYSSAGSKSKKGDGDGGSASSGTSSTATSAEPKSESKPKPSKKASTPAA